MSVKDKVSRGTGDGDKERGGEETHFQRGWIESVRSQRWRMFQGRDWVECPSDPNSGGKRAREPCPLSLVGRNFHKEG